MARALQLIGAFAICLVLGKLIYSYLSIYLFFSLFFLTVRVIFSLSNGDFKRIARNGKCLKFKICDPTDQLHKEKKTRNHKTNCEKVFSLIERSAIETRKKILYWFLFVVWSFIQWKNLLFAARNQI